MNRVIHCINKPQEMAAAAGAIVLAFDIETSGASFIFHNILGLGCVVMDETFKQLDRLFVPCFVKADAVFEKRCLDQFWSKNQGILKKLEVEGKQVSNFAFTNHGSARANSLLHRRITNAV